MTEPAYGQRHPASVRRWLLEQWRRHATDRERATEPATWPEPGPAGLRAEPDDDRYWQDHDGWQAVPLADRAVMHCVHCAGALTYGYDGPGTGWVHQQTHHNACPPQSTSGAAREVLPA
ncbi:hypothetical protein [Klenkia sp. PcliD-1-E]|uniref:hypothetical protein n=1 Tax=Klenkia sp. PcliD-1-E TaxID=2954492 RepID=UPI0020978DF0|nr:hypothetical protein [Klenkia sp. PcliD-1-E]MCO7219484.1 hypothetical protein [Klenkia sp. PcliD-1-E]